MFKKHFLQNPDWENPYDYVEYFRCLLYCGEFLAAVELIQQVLARFESDPYYADYCFYAGVVHKALREYETAKECFFESIRNGCPRYLSKIEMMTIISRNLEEMNAEIDDDSENAYHMVSIFLTFFLLSNLGIFCIFQVHANLVLEGWLSDKVEYEDWIYDAKTWLNLADKCAYHEMFPLAADFYSLAIMRDAEAYARPALWYRFAKSCYKCFRIADAQLAVQVLFVVVLKYCLLVILWVFCSLLDTASVVSASKQCPTQANSAALEQPFLLLPIPGGRSFTLAHCAEHRIASSSSRLEYNLLSSAVQRIYYTSWQIFCLELESATGCYSYVRYSYSNAVSCADQN